MAETKTPSEAAAQYVGLYNDNRALIESACAAPALNAARPAALATLMTTPLPRLGDEGYEKTSVEKIFAPDYGVNVARKNIPVDVARSFKCDVPNMSTLSAFVVNDTFVPTASLADRLPDGVTFMSLAEAARRYPDIVESHYGRLAPADSAAAALNTLLVQDGVFIHVKAGVRVEKPLQLVNIFSAPVPLAAFRRMLVVIEEGAELRLLVCDHTQDSERAYAASQVAEIFVGARARFEMCAIEESSLLTSRMAQTYVAQQEGSATAINTTALTCGVSRNEWRVRLDGEHAESLLSGMAIGSETMHIDNDTFVGHYAARCNSDQKFKYVLDGSSRGAFEGRILVTPSAPFTEAYQSTRNILASGSARMHCKPQLEIYNDEVKCSHGATTGQLDAEQIFYMRQRGIPEAEARTMLMQAFMIDIVDTVGIPGVADRLRHLVERRFDGSLGACASCHNNC